jgi:hypothetical protein
MIGIEEFGLANLFMSLAAATFILRLFKDTISTHPRRITPFVIGVLIAGSIVLVDIHLTSEKKSASMERDGQIPSLKSTIQTLQATVTRQNVQLNMEQAQSDQKLADIKAENQSLQKSVETKDAALVAIAKEQYSLNFVPQVFVVSTGTTNDQVLVVNNGKTNINMDEIKMEGQPLVAGNSPALITQGTGLTFTLTPVVQNGIASRAMGGSVDRLPIECEVLLTTLDKKEYSLKFTWLFTIKKGSMVRTDVIDRPIQEIEQR